MKTAIALILTIGLCAMQTVMAYGPYGPGHYGSQAPDRGWKTGPGQHPRYLHRLMQQRKQADEGPRSLLKEAVDKLRSQMSKSDAADKMKLAAFLETEISPFFDFAYMAQWAAGRRYGQMSDEQKAAMQGEIKKLFLTALSKGLAGSYSDSRLQITHARPARNGEMQVGLRVVRRNGPAVKMKFRFYRDGADWKIFDVIAFNSSAVMYFRKHFNQRYL